MAKGNFPRSAAALLLLGSLHAQDASSLRGTIINNPLAPLDKQGLGWNTTGNRGWQPFSYALQSGGSNYCAPAGGSTTTYTCNLTPSLTAYAAGLVVAFKPDVTNTASSTLNINSLGAKTIQKLTSGALANVASGDLVATVVYLLRYNGTVFVLDPGSSGTTSGVNLQTGTTYTFLNSDCGKLVSGTNASSMAYTLPQAGGSSQFISGCYIDVQNRGAGTMTITPTTSTIDGAATLVLYATQGVTLFSDGTNYYTQKGAVDPSSTLNVAGLNVLGSGAGTTKLYDPSGTYYAAWKGPPSPSASLVLPFPNTPPSGNQVLQCGTPSGSPPTSTCTWVTISGMDYASSATWTANGAVSAPAAKWNGTPYSGGSATTTKPMALFETSGTTSAFWPTNGSMVGINAPSGVDPLVVGVNGSQSIRVDQYGILYTGQIQAGSTVYASAIDFRNGATFTASGCSVGTLVGGSTAGSFTSGTTGACTVTVTLASFTASHAWACSAANTTTPANVYQQSGGSTTTAIFTGTTVSGDVIRFACFAY